MISKPNSSYSETGYEFW